MKRQDGTMYVQFGCGLTAPEGWRNFDASVTLRWEKTPLFGRMFTKNAKRFPTRVEYGDIVRGLPIVQSSCAGVYASHVLEHLALNDFHQAIQNTFQMLKQGGLFRLVVPDLEWSARKYIEKLDSGDNCANAFLLRSTCLGQENKPCGVFNLIHEFYGSHKHYWMWDAPSLEHALSYHGFSRVRRCQFGDSKDPMFRLVEDAGRFEQSVAMEAMR